MTARGAVLRLLRVERLCRVWHDELEGWWRWECRLCRPVWLARAVSFQAAHAEVGEHLRVWHSCDPAGDPTGGPSGGPAPVASVRGAA